jgi:hypothetical protein
VPLVVPTIPVFSFTSEGAAGVFRTLTPGRDGFMSRIGSSLYALPPNGMETAVMAWGFWAGPAPTGASSLTVLARGFTFVRGYCYSVGGYARAWATINATVEEFEPTKGPTERPVEHSGGLFDRPDPGTEDAEIVPTPTTTPGAFRLTRTVRGSPIILVNQETSVVGVQSVSIDMQRDAPGLFMPITPGNFYQCWIESVQWAISGVNGDAVSNIAFDFGAVFFAFN